MRIVPIRPASKPGEAVSGRPDDDERRDQERVEGRIIDHLFTSEDSEFSFALLRALFPDRTDATSRAPKTL